MTDAMAKLEFLEPYNVLIVIKHTLSSITCY